MKPNTKLVHRYYEGCFSAPGQIDICDEIFTEDISFINPVQVGGVHGIPDYKQFATRWQVGFPDRVFTVEETVEEGDRVAARFTIRAHHGGEFMGAAATGNPVNIVGMNMFYMREGRIYKVVTVWDPRQLWEPLGVTGPAAVSK